MRGVAVFVGSGLGLGLGLGLQWALALGARARQSGSGQWQSQGLALQGIETGAKEVSIPGAVKLWGRKNLLKPVLVGIDTGETQTQPRCFGSRSRSRFRAGGGAKVLGCGCWQTGEPFGSVWKPLRAQGVAVERNASQAGKQNWRLGKGKKKISPSEPDEGIAGMADGGGLRHGSTARTKMARPKSRVDQPDEFKKP